MSRNVGRSGLVSVYLYTRPVRYVTPEERKRKESELALICIRTHRAGCRCWIEKGESA